MTSRPCHSSGRNGSGGALRITTHAVSSSGMSAASPSPGDLRGSLLDLLRRTAMGWRFGVGRLYQGGLALGLGDGRLGPAYVDNLLEPLLQAVEARLAKHHAWGEARVEHPRFAALQLVSPLVLALLHQDGLGGAECRPLDLDAFIVDLADGFVRAHALAPA